MIDYIAKEWGNNKNNLEEYFKNNIQDKYCHSYLDILKKVFELVLIEEEYDLEKITQVDDGDYQGTLIFLIPKKTYQPSVDDYLITSVNYGSCSGCDTLQSIHEYDYERLPGEQEISSYMLLALHLIQKMKTLGDILSNP